MFLSFHLSIDKETSAADFVFYSKRAMKLLAEYAIAELPQLTSKTVQTHTGASFTGIDYPPMNQLCAVSIARAGDSLMESVRECLPGVSVGKILIQRKEDTTDKRPEFIYKKLPPDISTKMVILCDPMCATGGSAKQAIEVLVENGVKLSNIVFANMICCPEGLKAMADAYPEVKIVTACVDECLNEEKYIVPGLGDYGDRFFNSN